MVDHEPGFLTRGLTDPDEYYYRRAYCDVVRALGYPTET